VIKSDQTGSALSALGKRTEEPPISWLMSATFGRPGLISLAAGFTDNESLPVSEARSLLARVLISPKSGQSALQYGTTAGDPQLRRLTAERVTALDGPARRGRSYSPDRVIITNGSQQMLYMATEALCDPGDIVLLEDPTYFVYLSIVQSHGLRARGIRMQEDGIDLEHLELVLQNLKKTSQLRRVKLLYLVSYYQNPTAITTSYEKKIARPAIRFTWSRMPPIASCVLVASLWRQLSLQVVMPTVSSTPARIVNLLRLEPGWASASCPNPS
jgi:2-aminoadipate transaminase